MLRKWVKWLGLWAFLGHKPNAPVFATCESMYGMGVESGRIRRLQEKHAEELSTLQASHAKLEAYIKRLQCRLERRDEEIASLTRQRDTLLDCLDRVGSTARRSVAESQAVISHLQQNAR